jgi:hypothetical protein
MFANPFALLALGLLALPVLIHMLARLKGRRVLFPTTKYLRATESHRLKLTRVERWPLLAIRLLACGLLALAISDPLIPGEMGRSRAVLLLIDSSLSMNTEAAKEQARSRAREVAASLDAGDVAAVARFDDSIKLLCDFTGDRDSVEAGIESYSPRYAAADFSAALTWADKKLAAHPYRKELILISDLRAENVYSSEPPRLSDVDLKIIRVEVGRRVNARPGLIAARAAGDYLEVESTVLFSEGDRTTVTPVSFKMARRDKDAAAAASDSNAAFSAKVEGDVIVGAVTANRADEFDADDSRFFVAELPREEKILLVGSRLSGFDQAGFIEKAMRANTRPEAAVRRAEKSDSFPERADALARYSVVIAPIESLIKTAVTAAREYASRGGSLILSAGVGADAASAAEVLNELCATPAPLSLNTITSTDSLSLMPPASTVHNQVSEGAESIKARDMSALASARFRAAHSVRASGGELLLRYSNDGPAAVRVSVGAGHVIILGFGLSDKDSSLALSPVYPTFIEWLISSMAVDQRAGELIIGQAHTAGVLRGLTRLTLLYSIRGPALEVIADYQSALAEPGVYEAEYESGKSVFALNVSTAGTGYEQATESEMLERVAIAKTSSESVAGARPGKGIRLWRVLAIAALVMSLIELARMTFRRSEGGAARPAAGDGELKGDVPVSTLRP